MTITLPSPSSTPVGQAPPASGEPQKGAAAAARKAPPPAASSHRRLRVAVLGTLIAVVAWLLLYAFVLSPVHTAHRQRALYQSFRTALAKQTAPGIMSAPIPEGTAVALVDAPRGRLGSIVVVEGTSSEDLQSGPGHSTGTPLPGQPGTAVIYGRSVTFGGPFRQLTALSAGDVITTTTQQGTAHYKVDRVRHAGDPLPTPLAAGAGRLVLVTSEATGWRSGWAPTDAVYVDATLVDEPFVPPARVATQVRQDERPMESDTSGLIVVVLGLQGLLLAVGLAFAAGTRWSAMQTWLVSTPVVLAALWVTTEHAALLLPNLV